MRLWVLQCLLLSCTPAPFHIPLQESRAKCFFQAGALCHYAGKEYTLGESWVSTDCMLCTCLSPIGVGCCEILQHPIDFPYWCEAHYDARTCQISVVQKEDHSLPCMYSMDQESGSDERSENTVDNVFKTRFMS